MPAQLTVPLSSRRALLRGALTGAGLLVAAPWLRVAAALTPRQTLTGAAKAGLGPPDANGVRLPGGFRSRIVARAGELPVSGSSYRWPASPDGGACFAAADGGWVYVANSELPEGRGGVGVLRFDAGGDLVDADPILHGTTIGCGHTIPRRRRCASCTTTTATPTRC